MDIYNEWYKYFWRSSIFLLGNNFVFCKHIHIWKFIQSSKRVSALHLSVKIWFRNSLAFVCINDLIPRNHCHLQTDTLATVYQHSADNESLNYQQSVSTMYRNNSVRCRCCLHTNSEPTRFEIWWLTSSSAASLPQALRSHVAHFASARFALCAHDARERQQCTG